MPKGICEDCESVFEYKVNAFLCPDCRKKRLSRYAKEKGLSGKGRSAYSKMCAKIRAERKMNNE